ncbi:hypothetical protein H4R34_001212 [Dimargaris verticillata]|uniref:Tetratricopeptide SHNi-TPR domain-containing protein n=1 Tax=Dimargaris verticillata TaxID=2761393 RepID=A0A9W8B4W4_9FUNG|nr:hypothetical protein H4R34_001212 [Dimargaris verticillata]
MSADSPPTKSQAAASPSAAPTKDQTLKPEEKLVLDNAHVLVLEGKRALALGEFENAIDSFGEASQLIANVCDESSSIVYADVLVLYGKALLNNAIQQGALMAAERLKGTLAPGAQEEPLLPAGSKSQIHFEGEPDFRQVEALDTGSSTSNSAGAPVTGHGDSAAASGDEEEEEEEEENAGDQPSGQADEADDDFAAAWEVLELARLIYAKHDSPTHRLKEADILLILGDVSLESENFDQATKDYAKAVMIKEQLLKRDDRELAECYYKISLALEYALNYSEAIKHLEKVVQLLMSRRAHLREEAKDEAKAAEAEKEMQELQELMTEVNGKLDDLKATQRAKLNDPSSTTKSLLDAAFASTSHSAAASNANVQDISSLVRSKKSQPKGEGKQPDAEPLGTPTKRKLSVGEASDDKRPKFAE